MAVEQEIAALEEKDKNIDSQRARLLRPVQTEPRPQASLETLAAEYDKAEASYLALLDESRQAEIASLSQGPLVALEILENATVPEAPYIPDRRLFGLGGLVLGMALGLGLALVAESRDHSIKGPEDLQQVLLQPLLTTIPFVDARRPQRRP